MKKCNDVTEFPAQRDKVLLESELMKFTTYEQYEAWKQCAELAHTFLDSLPHGWLAHTSGDVGVLNEFYIKYRVASHLNSQQPTTAQH